MSKKNKINEPAIPDAIPNTEDFVMVYESTDGGTGDPRQTNWIFFVGDTAFNSVNPEIATTMRLALQMNRKVQVVADDNRRILQARISFKD